MESAMVANAESEARRMPRSARRGAGPGLALAIVICLAVTARAQQPPAAETAPAAQSPDIAAPQTAASAAAPRPVQKDGLFGTIGRWIDRSLAGVDTAWKGKSEASPEETRNGAGIGLLPNAKIVSGREHCETAANGAPDCRAAVEALCRSKGLAAGKSLDVQSAEKCPARVWISGTQPRRGECRMESYVQRALCR
jgi:hypothetical protein